MSSLVILAVIGAGAGVLYAGWRAILAILKQSGRDEAAAEEARRDVEAARRQSEIMGQQRTGVDVDARFDDGTF